MAQSLNRSIGGRTFSIETGKLAQQAGGAVAFVMETPLF